MKKIAVVMLAISLMLSCLSVTATAAQGEADADKLLVYLSGPEAMLTALEAGFEESRGDVADFLIMSCGEVRSKVWTEKEAGKIQADVVWGSDPLIYNLLDEEGLLCDLSGIENAAAIAEEYTTDHNYLLVNERYIAIIYNSDALTGDDVPTSFRDLLDTKYENRMVMADATQSSTALGIVSCLNQLLGIEYLEGLQANGMMLTKSNGQVPSLILEGQYDVGIAPHDAVIRLQNKAKKQSYEISLAIAWPSEGAVAIRRPIAIIQDDERSEAEQTLAEELVNYLLSKQAQTITTKYGFVSVRTDIENTVLPEGVEKVVINWDVASQEQETFKDVYEQIF
ncbi:MAG TPA: extracellular solute-binding protein [Candidatus Limiplasma sp.]|nr:extracellular solute-binding protein [Candidatus Limiplasma sp.]